MNKPEELDTNEIDKDNLIKLYREQLSITGAALANLALGGFTAEESKKFAMDSLTFAAETAKRNGAKNV